jgi:hypothetical protein
MLKLLQLIGLGEIARDRQVTSYRRRVDSHVRACVAHLLVTLKAHSTNEYILAEVLCSL